MILQRNTASLAKEYTQKEPLAEKEYTYPDIDWPQIDFSKLREINPDIVGWIYCEGTEINYPVVQAKDNHKYLQYLFNGTYNKAGCPFLDVENTSEFSDRHSIIYAHNRKDGSMFGRLNEYKKQDYYKQHPRILLITEESRYVMELFSGHVSRNDSNAWQIEFADTSEYEKWLNIILERSSFSAGILPQNTDRVLTLSTCSYEFDNARYVLHGVLRKAVTPKSHLMEGGKRHVG